MMTDEKDQKKPTAAEEEELFLDDDQEPDQVVEDAEEVEVPSVEDELREELEKITAERDELKDRLLRKAADAENARRRHMREKDDLRKFAAEGLLREVVTVLDDLDRALEHIRTTTSSEEDSTLLQGVEMVAKKFVNTLEKQGVKGFSSVGQPFDPTMHEAIQQVSDETVPHNTVAREFQRGYWLNERLLRPALVVVAQGGPAAAAPAEVAEVAETEPSAEGVENPASEENNNGADS